MNACNSFLAIPEKEDSDINPFSRDERDRIIEAFKNNRYYKHYAQFIEFLFMTGCIRRKFLTR
ncbi:MULTISPECIES: hypothetical protein [Fischerella]|uniref:hypothetical protein n=1 Tax=Fischerella TaxID=1190 RepID=UPI0015E10063|nr:MULTISPECIES: hypothetical protein [Fischerella]MBD2433922.1 hypothetical protein [Fischerella sp. FACHB-380]